MPAFFVVLFFGKRQTRRDKMKKKEGLHKK